MTPTVLITGASSGIGAACARVLAERGFRVFGTSRRPPATSDGATEWLAMDVRDEDSVREGAAALRAAAPRLDALVCNAGIGIFGSVEEVTIERARAQFETNFFGTLRVLRALLPGMRKAGSGRVAIVGSLAGRAPMPFRAHYSASKAALDALVLALAGELHPTGVRVSLIEPGDIATPFEEHADWSRADSPAYGERAARAGRVMRESLAQAPPPEIVARAVHRALSARRPRLRYAVGPSSRAVALGRRLLPDSLVVRMIRSHFGV